jgi:hypothetical protein
VPIFKTDSNDYPITETCEPVANGAFQLYDLDGAELDIGEWADRGTLSFLMRMEGIEDSRRMDLESGEYSGVKFLRGPAFDLHLYFTQKGAGGIGVIIQTESGEEKRYNAPLTHLIGNKTYHITLTWDLGERKFGVYYNGIPQGDIAHWSKDRPTLVLDPDKTTLLASSLSQHPEVKLLLGQFELADEIRPEATIREMDILEQLEPLVSEGRVEYDHPMALDGYALREIYAVDFAQPQRIVPERALFEGDKRIRLPHAEEEWILEGPEGMRLETREDGLRMETSDPDDPVNGAWVLWANRTFPENYLVEYSFTPRTDRQGLHILFFSAHNPDGDSIFDLDLPYRGGSFREYIVGAINSYHISPWATDGESLRATSNMRKNAGFHLVARGNDVIGGSGPGPHTVRILKNGGTIRMESNGIQCLAFDDDGGTYGPVYGEGTIGFRFMAHTGYATLHDLRVFEVDEE